MRSVFVGQVYNNLSDDNQCALFNELMGRACDDNTPHYLSPKKGAAILENLSLDEYSRLLYLNRCVFVSDIAISIVPNGDGFSAWKTNCNLMGCINPRVDSIHAKQHNYPIAISDYFSWYQLPKSGLYVYIFKNATIAECIVGTIRSFYSSFYPRSPNNYSPFPRSPMVFEPSRFDLMIQATAEPPAYPAYDQPSVPQPTYYSRQEGGPYRSPGLSNRFQTYNPGFFSQQSPSPIDGSPTNP